MASIEHGLPPALPPMAGPHQAVSWVSKVLPGNAAYRQTVPVAHWEPCWALEQHVSAHTLFAQRPERHSPSPVPVEPGQSAEVQQGCVQKAPIAEARGVVSVSSPAQMPLSQSVLRLQLQVTP